MTAEQRAWAFVSLVVAVITASVPVWIAIDQFERGGHPEKRVDLILYGPITPIDDLSPLADDGNLELVVGSHRFKNVSIWQMSLKNEGKAPIVPDDFFEPLRISVDPPWRIVSIRGRRFYTGPIQVHWTRISDTIMEATPFLFNPGDRLSQTVYVTQEGSPTEQIDSDSAKPKITARVTNLRAFSKPSHDPLHERRRQALVYLSFRDMVVLLLIANIFLAWYLRLLALGRVVSFPSSRAYLFSVGVAFLSYATAEVIVYYMFGGDPIYDKVFGRRLLDWKFQLHNWLILGLHVGLSVYLYRRARSEIELDDSADRKCDA